MHLMSERIIIVKGHARPGYIEAYHKTHRPHVKVGKDEENNNKYLMSNPYYANDVFSIWKCLKCIDINGCKCKLLMYTLSSSAMANAFKRNR